MQTLVVYEKDSNIVARKVGGELILVPIRQDAGDLAGFYSLNPVGARIWELIDGKRETAEIARIIFEEYEVEADRAEKETSEFIDRLAELGMIAPCRHEA